MSLRLVLLAFLALLPWQAGAQAILSSPALPQADARCRLEPGSSDNASGKTRAVCVWSVASELSPEALNADDPALEESDGTWLSPDWGYKSGVTLFVVGNAIAFSFPIWAIMGSDAVTIATVIIAGELIELVGIFMLGEEALHAIRDRLTDAVDQLRAEFRRWKANTTGGWNAISFERWY